MIDVTCAIIHNLSNEVLLVQRGEKGDHPLKWEFPGGKVDRGESREDSILRELREELNMEVVITGYREPVEHDYGHKQIRLIPFVCDTLQDVPDLIEHVAYKWLRAEEILLFDLAEADVVVAESYIRSEEAKLSDYCVELIPGNTGEQRAEGDILIDAELSAMLLKLSGVREAEWIASTAPGDNELIEKLFSFCSSGNERLAFRASWVLTKICEQEPRPFTDMAGEIAVRLMTITNRSVQRSMLKILSVTGTAMLDEKEQGLLADFCLSLLRENSSPVAVKVYSMDIMLDIVSRHKEMAHEFVAVMSMLPSDSHGALKSKSRYILKRLSDGGGSGL
jgi:8-oxo-dGTP diphosphatase